MRKLFILIAIWITVCACGTDKKVRVSQWAEDNNLWTEDRFDFATDYANQQMFNTIIALGHRFYDPVAAKWGERLTIVGNWQDSTVNASAWRDGRGNTEVMMYGGMARRAEVTPFSFALVLCHELGHLYAKEPYLEPSLRVSAEGQSDYAGAGWCYRNISENLPDMNVAISPYIGQVCGQNKVCMLRFDGAYGLGKLLSVLTGERIPQFETPDTSVVWRTNLSYPSVQCRLDSYRSGILWQQRPLCWFKP